MKVIIVEKRLREYIDLNGDCPTTVENVWLNIWNDKRKERQCVEIYYFINIIIRMFSIKLVSERGMSIVFS